MKKLALEKNSFVSSQVKLGKELVLLLKPASLNKVLVVLHETDPKST